MNKAAQRDRGAIIASVVSSVIVVLVALAATLLLWSVRDQLPEQVATHWGANDKADGFAPITASFFVQNALLCGLMPLVMIVLGLAIGREREMGPVGAGLGVFLTGLVYGSTWIQRGMTAEQVAASDPGPALLISGAAGTTIGVVLWLVFRRKRDSRGVPVEVADDAPRLLVDDQVRVAWTGHMRVSKLMWIVLGIGVLSMLIPTVNSFRAGSWSIGVFMLLMTVLIAAIGLVMMATVTVDAKGVRVKVLGRFSWASIPLNSVAGATVMPVSPLRDFGGWGSRLGIHGEQGIVTAGGPALRIERGADGPFIITVTGAEAAAATVNTLVARREND